MVAQRGPGRSAAAVLACRRRHLGRADGWLVSEPLDGPLDDALAVVAAHRLEGVVAKRLDSRSEPGRRSRRWRKHKLRRRFELQVAAWQQLARRGTARTRRWT
jgi:ATP-dependent DNA ligase